MMPDYIAQCASLAMALEVSATPKPGNVDREHNYPDTRYEHFLASVVAAYPVIREAAAKKKSFGKLLAKAVGESNLWQNGGNTHFGAFILLIPLAMAKGNMVKAHELVKNTTVQDAVYFYQAFAQANVKVAPVSRLSLEDSHTITQIQQQNKTMYQLMQIAEHDDEIAREWTHGFPLTKKAHQLLTTHVKDTNINEAIVKTYLEILKDHPDTFIRTKHNKIIAIQTSKKSAAIVDKIHKQGYLTMLPEIREFDEQLLSKKINPGSTADIIISGLFLLLLGGYRF